MALLRGFAAGRGAESADTRGHEDLWQAIAEAACRADPPGGAVEIRLQKHQVDCEDRVSGQTTEDVLGNSAARGIPI